MQGPYFPRGPLWVNPYQRVSDSEPSHEQSLTPHADAINRGQFTFYPDQIYQKEPVYIPRNQPSGVWKISRDQYEDPRVYDMRSGGTLTPTFSRYVPPDFAPGPLGLHPGLSYVRCPMTGRATRDPPDMAPPKYYL